jgi:hypothetical protein
MNLTEWSKEIHENAKEHGWWDEPRSFAEIIALCHSELSEALEEDRSGRPLVYFPCNAGGTGGMCCDEQDTPVTCGSRPYNPENPDAQCSAQSKKPEGAAVEMADCIIRILDWAGREGIDIERIVALKHEYNRSRPYKHGKAY